MRGHIRQRSKGSWEVVVDAGKDPSTGQRCQHFETVRGSKKDAQQRLAELQVSITKGSYVKPKRLTVGEWLEQWLSSYVAANCSPKTRESYTHEVSRHIKPELGNIPLTDLRSHHVQAYIGRELSLGRADGRGGLSPRSVQYHRSILGKALNEAVSTGLIQVNVAKAVRPPRLEARSIPSLVQDDIHRLLDAIDESPYRVAFRLLLYTGLRRGEALGLRWRDVDVDMSQLYVTQALYRLKDGTYIVKEPKTNRSRRCVDIPPSLAILLRQHRNAQEAQRVVLGKPLTENDLVFQRSTGDPLDPEVISKAFSRLLKRAGLPHLRLHDLRHIHATLLLKDGIHPKIVSERLGHASIAITLDTYSHVVPGLQKAAAERFDALFTAETNSGAEKNVGKMLANEGKLNSEAHRTRTCNRLIKSQLLCRIELAPHAVSPSIPHGCESQQIKAYYVRNRGTFALIVQ